MASSAPNPPAFVNTAVPSALPPAMNPAGIPSITAFTILIPDAPRRLKRGAGAVAADEPQHVPLTLLDELRKFFRELVGNRRAWHTLGWSEHDSDIWKFSLEACDLSVRHGIEGCDEEQNAGIENVGIRPGSPASSTCWITLRRARRRGRPSRRQSRLAPSRRYELAISRRSSSDTASGTTTEATDGRSDDISLVRTGEMGSRPIAVSWTGCP